MYKKKEETKKPVSPEELRKLGTGGVKKVKAIKC